MVLLKNNETGGILNLEFIIYLAGKIQHQLASKNKEEARSRKLPFQFVGPIPEKHDLSDNIGENILGEQPNAIFKDQAV